MSDEQQIFEHAAIIGPGLIGGSIARAAQETDAVGRITGYDKDERITARALELGVIDDAASDIASAVGAADLIVIATPVGAASDVFAQLKGAAAPGAVIIDVGSVKKSVCDAAANLRDDLYFVPCHPVAGTEQSGPDAGFAKLFEDRWCIITPPPRDDAPYRKALQKVERLWAAFGAHVEVMDADHHDLALAVTSHLPHLIAFTLVGAADDVESVAQAEVIKYSAGGFRDFTRIAASDPIMWRDVFLNNKDAILEVLGRFSEELSLMQRAIRWGDGEALEKAFARGRSLRRAIVDAGQETAAPNFGRDEEGH
ncbi:MAG: prephenate/arogenate dehydrogenase family protein [Marinicaulis sp.]|nr:prephenate/arogenate dehydrogenase family protein [Marinicaulis sp.]